MKKIWKKKISPNNFLRKVGSVTGNRRLEVTCIQLSTLMGYWKVKTGLELSLALKAVKETAKSLYYHRRIWKKKKEFWVYRVFSKARGRERGRQSNKMARGWDGHCQEAQPVWNSWQWVGTTKWFTYLAAPWTWFHLCAICSIASIIVLQVHHQMPLRMWNCGH